MDNSLTHSVNIFSKQGLSLSLSIFVRPAYGTTQSNKQSTKTECDDNLQDELIGVERSN